MRSFAWTTSAPTSPFQIHPPKPEESVQRAAASYARRERKTAARQPTKAWNPPVPEFVPLRNAALQFPPLLSSSLLGMSRN